MKTRLFVSMVMVAGLGCGHQQKPATTEVHALPPAVPASPPRSQVEVSARPDTGAVALGELEQSLRGATVYFDFDSDRLSDEGLARLQRVGEVLRRHPSLAVEIDGNCDERGTEEYNLALGQRRAAVARKYLVALGVRPAQVDTLSWGDERPAVPGHSEQAWAKNRRDELITKR
jgi:peptidoglycan-associated lipoprotein